MKEKRARETKRRKIIKQSADQVEKYNSKSSYVNLCKYFIFIQRIIIKNNLYNKNNKGIYFHLNVRFRIVL